MAQSDNEWLLMDAITIEDILNSKRELQLFNTDRDNAVYVSIKEKTFSFSDPQIQTKMELQGIPVPKGLGPEFEKKKYIPISDGDLFIKAFVEITYGMDINRRVFKWRKKLQSQGQF